MVSFNECGCEHAFGWLLLSIFQEENFLCPSFLVRKAMPPDLKTVWTRADKSHLFHKWDRFVIDGAIIKVWRDTNLSFFVGRKLVLAKISFFIIS